MHFGSHHAFPLEIQNNKRPLWLALQEAIKELGLNIGGVIISGDFVFKPVKKEFDMAENFVKDLNSGLKLDNYDYIFCPGNHDFGFYDLIAEDGKEISKPSDASTEAYSNFYEKHFYIKPHTSFACGRRFLLNNTYPVEIVALNSIALQQTEDAFQGYGFVGHEQLEYVEEQLDWTSSPEEDIPVRILVIHHHLLPVTYSESTKYGSRYSLTLDAEKITRWALKHGVKLILHGHMHQLYFTQLKRPIEFESSEDTDLHKWPYVNTCGLGSTGVEESHLGNYKSNTFGVIQFKNNRIILKIYKIDPEVPTEKSHLVCEVEIPIKNEYNK